jgi:topoisomerase IA-like protein
MQLKYVDYRPMFLPRLTHYRNGITLPNETNIIEVTDKEAHHLLKHKNGNKNCYEKIEPKRPRQEVKEQEE